MPLITNDEGRLVFLPNVDTPGEALVAPAAAAASAPRDDMSHLSAQQGLLLALARVDQDRACRHVAAKRGRDSEEDGRDTRVAGRPDGTTLHQQLALMQQVMMQGMGQQVCCPLPTI